MDDEFNWVNIAAFGYEAYAESSGNKNYQGNPMPKWDDLPKEIKQHWAAAARAISEVFGRAVTA